MLVFDAEPLIDLLTGEREAKRLIPVLERIQRGTETGGISFVNLAEIYYVLRRRSLALAEQELAELKDWGLRFLSADPVWKQAADLKANHGLPLADAFAAATAIALGAKLVCGNDAHFTGLSGLVTLRP